jgi:predicted transcriptional regulator
MSRTSIPVDSETKERLDELKRDDETWDEFLTRVTSDQEPIRQGDLSEEALDEIERNIEASRESF